MATSARACLPSPVGAASISLTPPATSSQSGPTRPLRRARSWTKSSGRSTTQRRNGNTQGPRAVPVHDLQGPEECAHASLRDRQRPNFVWCVRPPRKNTGLVSAPWYPTPTVFWWCAPKTARATSRLPWQRPAAAKSVWRSLTARAGTLHRSSNSSGRQLQADSPWCASTYRCAVTRLWRTGTPCSKCCRVSLKAPYTQCWSNPRHWSVTHVPGTTAIA